MYERFSVIQFSFLSRRKMDIQDQYLDITIE